MSIDKVIEQEKKQDKVPVHIDRKTVVWVKRDKCEQQPDGTWKKIGQLNIETSIEKMKRELREKAQRAVENKKKHKKKDDETNEESEDEIHTGI